MKIPAAVREHYLAYSGGYPEKPVFTDKSVGWFIPVCGEKKRSVENMLRILKEDEAIPNWLIPFADEAGGNKDIMRRRITGIGFYMKYGRIIVYVPDDK